MKLKKKMNEKKKKDMIGVLVISVPSSGKKR